MSFLYVTLVAKANARLHRYNAIVDLAEVLARVFTRRATGGPLHKSFSMVVGR